MARQAFRTNLDDGVLLLLLQRIYQQQDGIIKAGSNYADLIQLVSKRKRA